MKLSGIRIRAKRNTLEVEHLLKAAKLRTSGLQNELKLLSQELEWSDTPYPAPGVHVVPLARWALVVGAYAEEGFSGLSLLASDERNAPYILAVIEEVKSVEAATSMITFFENVLRKPSSNMQVAHHVTSACNILYSFKDPPALSRDQAQLLQSFLMSFYTQAEKAADKALSICALRGIGDTEALQFVENLPALEFPYVDLNRIVIKAVKKRLAREAI